MNNKNIFNYLYNFKKKKLFIYRFFFSKLYKYLNIINIFYNKKYSFFKKLFFGPEYWDITSYDNFNKDKPAYKKLIFLFNFININKLNRYMKAYMKFFQIKEFPLNKISNDFLASAEFNIKRENIVFKYKSITDYIFFNIAFFYWIWLIPYFLLNYILSKYHLKLFIKIRRRFFYFLKAYLDNMRLIVRVNKYIGRPFFKSIYRSKRWKDLEHVFLIRKKAKRTHFIAHNLRYRKLYYRLSPLGSYYFWFSKINLVQYVLSFKNFFFKSGIKSIYYSWLIIIYWFIFLYLLNKFNKYKNIKKFIFIKFI